MELDEGLNQWLEQIEQATTLSVEDQAKITQAGAKVFQQKLADATRISHYGKHNRPSNTAHLADSVVAVNKSLDNVKDGTSTVAFDKQTVDHGRIARFLNDGTKKIHGDHFVDNARKEAMPAVLEAEMAAYKKLQGRDTP